MADNPLDDDSQSSEGKNQTISGGQQQFADKIQNITHIHNASNPEIAAKKTDTASSVLNFFRTISSVVKYASREKVSLSLMVVLVALAAATELKELKFLQGFYVHYALATLSVFCFLYIVYRVIVKLAIPKPTSDIPLPNSIKGLMAFTADDGLLFRKLEREVELSQLKNYVFNPQIPLVVMMGESGAGKTSLLRAGLSHILKDSKTKYVYWEALPHDAVTGLLKTVKQGLTLEITQLSELLTTSVKAVIVLDQFEQLLPSNPQHAPIFELLKNVAFATPPHSVTWLVAFRREYLPYWRDFELDQHLKQFETISLKLFSTAQASDEAGLSMIPALRQLGNSVLGAVVQADLTLQMAYGEGHLRV